MSEQLFLLATALSAVVVLLGRFVGAGAVAVGIAVLAAFPLFGGVRDVLLPGILGLGLLSAAVIRNRRHAGKGRRGTVLLAVGALLGVALSGLAVWLIPLAGLASPGGTHPVGIRDWVWVDSSRIERLTDDPDDRRVLAIRAWYPADPATVQEYPRADYLPHAREVYRGMARSLDVPTLVVSGISNLKVNGRLGAPVSGDGPFPLLLYSGGLLQGHQAHNSELAEELASRGYVVVGVNHPWEESFTLQEDGTLVTLDDPRVRKAAGRIMGETSSLGPLPYEELLALGPEGWGARIQAQLESLPNHVESAAVWLEDMRALLRAIEDPSGPVGSLLAGHVGTERLGIFGMSFGGAAAGAFCATEPRCAGGVSLDGTQWGPWFGDDYRTPFLSMSQDLDTWNDFFFAGAGRHYHRVKVRGAYHGDFTDGFQSTPLTRFAGVLGPIGGSRSTEILRAYVTAFFDHYVRGMPAPLLEGVSSFPEVEHVRDPLGPSARPAAAEEGDLP